MKLLERRERSRNSFSKRGVLILLPRFFDVTIVAFSLSEVLVVPDKTCEIEAGQSCALRIVNSEGWQIIELGAMVSWASEFHVGLTLGNVTPAMEQVLRPMFGLKAGAEAMPKREMGVLMRRRDSGAGSNSASDIH